MNDTAVGIGDLHAAAARLGNQVARTPVLGSPMLDALAGARLFVKAESLQRTGSFKFRGALNKLLTMDEAERARGLIAYSAGNHGHAVAAAAAQMRCPATIVLPNTAPRIKVENCRWWGAEIVLYDPATEDREEVGRRIAEPRGLTLVAPFDDDAVIAGQGTMGLELAEQLRDAGAVPDAFVVCCSGGGLAAGSVLAMRNAFPTAECFIVEPTGLDKMARSLRAGTPQGRPAGPGTIMDGIAGPVAGRRTTALLRGLDVRCLTVSDDEALRAMAEAFRFLKLVAEPAGAAPLAAVLSGKAEFAGRTVALVCSGGNVDEAMFARALA